MALYPFALFTHIVGILAMFIAIALEFTSIVGMRRAGTTEELRSWAYLGIVPERIFPFAGLLALAAGVYMALVAWGWQTAWINVSLVTFLLMFVVGPLVNSRRLKALHQAARQSPSGAISRELARQIEDPVLFTCVFTLNTVSLGVLFLMTTKPGLVGSLIALLIAILFGLFPALLLSRAGAKAPVAKAQEPNIQ